MKSMGKILGALVIAGTFAFCGLAEDSVAVKNLLKTWNSYGTKGATIIGADGVIACENKTEQDASGVVQTLVLDQKEAKPISFSAENKTENVSGKTDVANYSIYLDITYADNTKKYGVTAAFKTGTHDWEKASASFTPEKPIKSLSYYMLFRKKTGKVWFRNAILTEEDAKK